jgi:predicted membrane protein
MMRMDLAKLRTLSVVFWILLLPYLFYNLHRKYHSIEVCQAQQLRLDAIEAQLGGMKK